MSKAKSPLATIVIIALVLVLLYALNPTRDDFIAWRTARAERAAGGAQSSGLEGVMKKGAGAIAGAMTGLVAGGFSRSDYLLCSTYSLGGKKGELYLGAARLFVKLR